MAAKLTTINRSSLVQPKVITLTSDEWEEVVWRRELRVHLQNQVQGWKKKLIKLKGKMKVHKPKSDAFTHQNLNLEILCYEGCEGQKNVSMGFPIGKLFWDMDIDWFGMVQSLF